MADRRNASPRRKSTDRRVEDRRDTPRLNAQIDIRFMRADAPSEILYGQLLEASPTGVGLLLDTPIATDERLLIEVRSEQSCFNLTATARWVELASDSWFRVGCELAIELSAKQLRTLKKILEAGSQTTQSPRLEN